MPIDIEPCPNSTWDNEWTFQFAHITLCFVRYDTCAYIAPMAHIAQKSYQHDNKIYARVT
jgi:hypothetical protein